MESVDNILEDLANKLEKRDKFLSCAESCTSGYISYLIATSERLSKHFNGSVVSYSPELKTCLLNVSNSAAQNEQAVNEQCAKEMLLGALNQCKSDYAIAVTGFAGPDGGTLFNPIGTVWIAVGSSACYDIRRYKFGEDRLENISAFAHQALKNLLEFLSKSA